VSQLVRGLSLLAVLGVHEFGHYAAGRWHRVDVTLPYFIPVPMGLGTFGAFIQIRSLIKSRRAVFDIGIAGPLAGLVIALPALYFGLRGTLPLAEGTPAPRASRQAPRFRWLSSTSSRTAAISDRPSFSCHQWRTPDGSACSSRRSI
jgi:membrane-associated protease RseP (regulator of RpoE activity)